MNAYSDTIFNMYHGKKKSEKVKNNPKLTTKSLYTQSGDGIKSNDRKNPSQWIFNQNPRDTGGVSFLLFGHICLNCVKSVRWPILWP